MTRAVTFLREHQRWLIVVLLFFVAMVNNLDRQSAFGAGANSAREVRVSGRWSIPTSSHRFLAAYAIRLCFLWNACWTASA